MALYSLNEFQSLVAASKWTYLNERRAFKHLDKLNWGNEDLAIMLCGLQAENFRKTFKNNKINDFPGQDYVDADHFVVHWDMDEHIRRKYPTDSTLELSVKIAILTDASGNVAGVVDFHLSGSVD